MTLRAATLPVLAAWRRSADAGGGIAWRLLLGLAALKVALHTLANGPLAYGLMTDELYYLDCTRHLDWGYVDHPPLSIWVLWAMSSVLGESIQAVRGVATLSGAALLVAVGALAHRLGGGRAAQGLAGLAVLVSPLLLGTTFTYTMNALELLAWAGAAWIVVLLVERDGRGLRLWIALGTVLGLGLLNKVSMLWFGAGLAAALLATPHRTWLRTPGPWIAATLAALIYAPNVLWNVQHGWPMLEFLRNSAAVKEFTYTGPLGFVVAQLVVMGVPFWILGLVHLFSEEGRRFRVLGWIFVAVFGLLLASGSAKAYYLAPAYPPLLAAAGVWLERRARGTRGPVYGWAVALGVTGVVAAPLTISLAPPALLARHTATLGDVFKVDATEGAPLPQHFAQMFHGRAAAEAAARAWATLSPQERARAAILTGQFGEAGGINRHGDAWGLPRAIGTDVSYWLWGPRDADGELLVVFADDAERLRAWWREVEPVAAIDCAWCMPYLTRKSVYVVRGLRRPFPEIWEALKDYR